MTRPTASKPITAALAALLLSGGCAVAATASPAHDAAPAGARLAAAGKDKDKVPKEEKDKKGAEAAPESGGTAAPVPAATPQPAGAAPTVPASSPANPPAKGKEKDKKEKDGAEGPGAPAGKAPAGAPAPGSPEPTALPPAAAPVLANSVAAEPVSGAVVVRLPGTQTILPPLADVSSLPVGSVIDARAGTVELTSVHDARGSQTAEFHGAVFSVRRGTGKRPTTVLSLRGGEHSQCDDAPAARAGGASASARRKPIRRLWGSGHGRFTTKGRHSAATVRGTVWLTEDRCDGTLTRVERGVVSVRDHGRGRTVAVRKGHSYFARAAR